MDTNLTGAIATTVTLNQSWFSGSIPLLVGAILGAIVTGGITLYRDKINNKRNNDNLLIQTYSKLIGEKFVLCQSYENILSISIDIDYNCGLIKEAEHMAKKAEDAVARDYLRQAEQIEEINTPNRERHDRELLQVTKSLRNLWENIGLINGLIDNEHDKHKVQILIKNIKKSIEAIEKFQRDLSTEIENGLPKAEMIKMCKNEYRIKSTWAEENRSKITAYIMDLEAKIDDLLNFVYEMHNHKKS